MIGVLEYKAGNAPSVLNALAKIGAAARPVASPAALGEVAGVILPGVGSAQATMDSLEELGLIPALRRRVLEEGLPFLGICVGLQILFERSEEGGATCLGWLAGEVARFPPGVRVPQIGWNRVAFSPTEPLGAGVAGGYFYFVNSYYARPAEPVTAGETEYGVRFASVVRKGNVAATQFHLEKSGETGLRVLKNFAEGIVC